MLAHIDEYEESIHEQFQRSAATRLVNAIRSIRVFREIAAVGMLSLYEAALKDSYGWQKPFPELVDNLNLWSEYQIASDFHDLVCAINVLKHGRGQSYEKLLGRRDKLSFNIKGESESFFFEGDVSEGSSLIQVDSAFVRMCGDLIDSTRQLCLSHL